MCHLRHAPAPARSGTKHRQGTTTLSTRSKTEARLHGRATTRPVQEREQRCEWSIDPQGERGRRGAKRAKDVTSTTTGTSKPLRGQRRDGQGPGTRARARATTARASEAYMLRSPPRPSGAPAASPSCGTPPGPRAPPSAFAPRDKRPWRVSLASTPQQGETGLGRGDARQRRRWRAS